MNLYFKTGKQYTKGDVIHYLLFKGTIGTLNWQKKGIF